MRRLFPAPLLAATLAIGAASPARAAVRKVCVDVQMKSWSTLPAAPTGAAPPRAAPTKPESTPRPPSAAEPSPDAPADSADELFVVEDPAAPPAPAVGATPAAPPAPVVTPVASTPAIPTAPARLRVEPSLQLRRLLEYEITHDVGYEAVSRGCADRLVVELYEVEKGWTVFGRFSRYAREEKVDHVQLDEFAALAERLATALLHDVPITDTVTRQNVLRADSEAHVRSIKGTSHAAFGLGTSLRIGELRTAGDEPTSPAETRLRVLTPLAFGLGYRGKFRAWGLEATGRLEFGTNHRSGRQNEPGGHVDLSGGGGVGLHFLRYLDAPGMNSVYVGGGASFELLRFEIVRPIEDRDSETRDDLWSGGLALDVVVGYEVMRASNVQFYTQLDVKLPTYPLQDENATGSVDTYLPGALAQVGILF